MFDQDWMVFLQREAPFSYYCVIFISFLCKILFYCSYLLLLFVVVVPAYLLFSGIKSIKIKLVEDKEHKKLRKQTEKNQEHHQNRYLERLDRNIKKKKHHHK